MIDNTTAYSKNLPMTNTKVDTADDKKDTADSNAEKIDSAIDTADDKKDTADSNAEIGDADDKKDTADSNKTPRFVTLSIGDSSGSSCSWEQVEATPDDADDKKDIGGSSDWPNFTGGNSRGQGRQETFQQAWAVS